MSTPWMERVRRFVARSLGAGACRRWVVAVSGGSDSVGLLRVLHALAPGLGLELSVAHLNHGARGEAGRRDAEFVGALAAALGLPFDLGEWAPVRAAHFEADARRARYAWLVAVARRRGASAVAVGHTRDDQAETVLHRIVRGTGPRGLAGMPRRRALGDGVGLVRPLLGASRDEVRTYLAALGQPFRDDPTNADRSRTRARIRHDLLPRLASEYNPRVVEALVRLGDLSAAAERTRRRGRLARLRRVTEESGPEQIVLRRRFLAALDAHERAEVLRLAWRRAGWPERAMHAAHWAQIAALAYRGAGRATVGGGVDAASDGDVLILRRAATVAPAARLPFESLALPIPGAAAWAGGGLETTLDADAPRNETVDLDALDLPLIVRPKAPGDRFDPLGMGGRTVGLNDFLRSRGVARDQRGDVPLVCDRAGIVWVVGHRIAHRVRVTPETTRMVGLCARSPHGEFDAVGPVE